MKRRSLYPLSYWIVWAAAIPLGLLALLMAIVATTSAQHLPFDRLDLGWLLAAVPLATLIFLHGRHQRKRAIERFTSGELAPLLAARVSPGRQAFRAGLFVTALVMIVAAILGPRWGIYMEKQQVRGVDIVVALDVSRSMLAQDVAPNRLERAKTEIREQLSEREIFHRANRLALLAFAGSTSLRVPLTTDHPAFRSKLEAVRVGSAPRGGTAIGQAIESAVDLLSRSPQEAAKIVLVFTDGEDHEGDPVEAAKAAYAEKNIRVFTIGVGDPNRGAGVEVPAGPGGAKQLLHDGQIVFSKLDAAGLRKIAEAGGGQYAHIGDFRLLVDAIANLRPATLGVEERQRHRPRYQWFLAAALVLLALETTIREGRPSPEGLPQRVWLQEMSSV